MELVTTAAALSAACKIVKPAVERRASIPVLSHVLISEGAMTATDLDIEIRANIACSAADGAICLDHRVLSTIAGNLPPDAKVTISADKAPAEGKRGATLAFDGGLYTLCSLPPEDFPTFQKRDTTDGIEAPDDFVDKLLFVSRFISTEETRYYLNGVCIDSGLLAATDGHRLAYVDAGFDVDGRPIIPHITVKAILAIGRPSRIVFGDKVVVVDFPGVTLRSKLIDGTYPDIRRVIPTVADDGPKLVLPSRDLVGSLKRVSATLGSRRLQRVELAVSRDGRVAVACDDLDYGTARETISATVSGVFPDAFLISFNGRYLEEIAKAHRGSGTLTLKFVDAGAPVTLTSEREGYSTVLMPMRGGDRKVALEALTLLAPVAQLQAAE